MRKKAAALIIALSLTAGMITGCSGSKLDNSEVIIEIGDQQVTADVANFYARYQQSYYETYYAGYLGGDDMWSTEASDGMNYEETVKNDVLDALESMYVLDAHKEEHGVEITEEEREAIGTAAKEFIKANGEDELSVVSGTEDAVKKVLELLTVQDKMYDVMTADVDTEVSDDEAAQKKMVYVRFAFTYTDDDGNSVEYTEDELKSLKKEAEEFAELAAEEDDFSNYATEKGYDPQETTFDSESTSPASELIEAADELGEGETTGLIETDSAYYAAKVVSLLDRDATDTKKESIVSERKDEHYQKLLDEWIEEADPQVNKSAWAKVDFNNQGVTIKQIEEATEDETKESEE